MQLYWSFKSIPELSRLPPAERRRVWRSTHWGAYRHWQTWAALAAVGIGSAAGMYFGLLLDPSMTSQVVGGAIGAGFGGLVYGQVVVEMARPYLRSSSRLQQPGGESRQ